MVSTRLLISKCQSFGDCTKSTNYHWYNRHFPVLKFFSILKTGPGTYRFPAMFPYLYSFSPFTDNFIFSLRARFSLVTSYLWLRATITLRWVNIYFLVFLQLFSKIFLFCINYSKLVKRIGLFICGLALWQRITELYLCTPTLLTTCISLALKSGYRVFNPTAAPHLLY